jgi:hypothetical protein
MNEKLIYFLFRSEIRKLPEEKRKLYQFIVKEENQLAQYANTPNQFLDQLAANSPYEFAANFFELPYEMVFKLMNTIEEELIERVKTRYENVKLIDYTDYGIQTNIGVSISFDYV